MLFCEYSEASVDPRDTIDECIEGFTAREWTIRPI